MAQTFAAFDESRNVIGFYVAGLSPVPAGVAAVEITDAERRALLAGQASGKRMTVLPDGKPALVDSTPTLDATKTRCLKEIDDTADRAREDVAGNALRAKEYEIAEAEASAFQAAGFTGPVPTSIVSWADAKGWTAQAAAENILAEARAWYAAMYAIRDARLRGKEGVRAAQTVDEACTISDTACAAIKAMVAGLGNGSA